MGFPLYLAGFIPIVVLLAVGGATMMMAVGVPVVVAGLVLTQGTAAVERALKRSLLGARLPEPVAVAHPRDPGVVCQVTSLFRDRQRWGDAVFSLLAWAPTCAFWSVAFSWWVTILAGLSYPAWQCYLPEGELGDGMATWLNLPDEYWAHALCNVALGLLLLALAPIAMRGLARAQAGANGWLLEAPTRTVRLEQAHRRQLADTHEAVRVHVDGPWVVAEVEDDGVGGAHLGKGTGLAGLDRRLAGLGGHLTVTSPQGGPTVIRAEVPCVS